MKRIITGFLALTVAGTALAQNFVSTSPTNKNVLLEGIGGINCYYCAEADATAESLLDAQSGRLVWINIHAGIFAEPGSNEPDFRSSYADTLLSLSGMTAYPAAMINRRYLPDFWQNNGKLAIETQNWAAAADTILNEVAQVNVAARSEFNISSRQLKVVVESYYTFMSTTAPNKLFVAMLLDSILGPQEGASVYNPSALNADGNYMHRNILFDYISSGLGISNPTSGNFRADTFYYNVPADFNGGNFELFSPKVAVWITGNDYANVINAAYSEMTLISNEALAANILSADWDADFNQICGSESALSLEIQNLGNSAIDSVSVGYDINSGASSGNFTVLMNTPLPIGKTTTIQLPVISGLNNSTNTVLFGISNVNTAVNPNTDQISTQISKASLFVSDSTNGVLKVRFDNYPTDISWELIDETAGDVIVSDSNYAVSYAIITQNFTAVEGHCYALKLTDAYGDGLCCNSGQGYYELKIGNLQIFRDDEFDFESGLKFTFEEGVIAVNQTAKTSFEATVFPNPATTEVTLRISTAVSGDVEMAIYNGVGQKISSKILNLNEGTQFLPLSVEGLAPGFYLISLNKGGVKSIVKLIIAK